VADWQVTATTIYCDAVDDDVTILVYKKDWSTKCTGYRKYVDSLDNEGAKMLQKKAKRLGRNLKCEGPQDYRVTSYLDKLSVEEKKANSIQDE
jgi:hypothetical protein